MKSASEQVINLGLRSIQQGQKDHTLSDVNTFNKTGLSNPREPSMIRIASPHDVLCVHHKLDFNCQLYPIYLSGFPVRLVFKARKLDFLNKKCHTFKGAQA